MSIVNMIGFKGFDWQQLSEAQMNEEIDAASIAIQFIQPNSLTHREITEFISDGFNALIEMYDPEFHIVAHREEFGMIS